MEYSIEFCDQDYTVETAQMDGKTIRYRSFKNLVYVTRPVDPEYQRMNIYVPEGYYEDPDSQPFTLDTAPILMPNGVGGYMPGEPQQPGKTFAGWMNAAFYALMNGYVVAAPGARGRGLTDENGHFTGTAPACIVDLKAAVRYLRHNRGKVPGDVERIISNGTSAGGALSSLLGSTGNHPDYEPYLNAIGAAKERDDIFAASCYCPITNLDHADMAYEWEFCGLDQYKFREDPVKEMTKLQKQLSPMERDLFPAYLNHLHLKDEQGQDLVLNEQGEGSFREYIKRYVMLSAQRALDQGTDMNSFSWMTIGNGKVQDLDWDGYVSYRTRMKATPAFDDVQMTTPENELFGNAHIRYRHFTQFSMEHSTVSGELAESDLVKKMNPMYYIEDSRSTVSRYFRIRHGAADRDTSLAISAILTLKLRSVGVEVDYFLPWGIPHSGDYDLDELFIWIRDICKN